MFSTKKQKSFSFPGVKLMEEMYDGFALESNLLVRPDGVITAGISIIPKEEEMSSEEQILNYVNSFANIIKTLPVGTVLHFQKCANYVTSDLETEGDGFFLKKLKSHFDDRPLMRKKISLYVSFDFYNSKVKNSLQTMLRFKPQTMPDIASVRTNMAKVIQLVNGFLTQINSLDSFKAKAMLSSELIANMYEYHNLGFLLKSGTDALSTTHYCEGNHVKSGQYKVAFVNLHDIGSVIPSSKKNDRLVTDFLCTPLDRINFPHVINTAIFIPDNNKTLEAIDFRNRFRATFSKFTGQSGAIAMEQDAEFTKEIRSSGDSLVHLEQNVMLWSLNDATLDDAINHTKAAYNTMNNSMGIVCSHDALNFFTTFSPGMARDMFYPNLVTAHQAFCFPSLSAPTASESEGILFGNRSNEPILLDLFSNKLENKNAILIGPSGSGKSVTAQYWIVQNYDKGYDQTIIDIGGSYINVVEMLDGKYYRHSEEDPISMNPFLLPKDSNGIYVMDNEKMIFLTTLISVLWKDGSKGESLSKTEEAMIGEFLIAYVVHVNNTKTPPRLDRFYTFVQKYVENKDDKRLQSELTLFEQVSFFAVLRKYCDPTSRYYKILNSDSMEDISQHRLIAFDMAGVEKDPLVYPFMSLIIIDLVFSKFMKLPLEMRKYLFMDEAWSFLGNSPQLAKFIESMFRTCRKMNAGAVVITQSVTELQTSAVGIPIRNNTAIKILLDHRTQTSQLDTIRDFLGFTPMDMEKLKSLRAFDTRKEGLIKRGDVSQVVMIDTGPHQMAAFSTRPDEKAELRALVKKFGNIQMAVNYFVESKKKKAA
ncbi:MAG: ATP-binding protein [Cytophagales bacterium]|nr:ATP-binding protein [Cytophagales bacterium]MCA6372320.1 ATP-binding protein [Cytophagales bacterium]MCA6382466.1 ATP-binding protein [Cytophagales bacterium]